MPINMTCILCPLSCQLELQVANGEVMGVHGNGCQQGIDYAGKEYLCPCRVLTATAALQGGQVARIPVRTRDEVPKANIPDCMMVIQNLRVLAPVQRGQVLIADLAGTGIDLIASRSMAAS